MCEKFATGYGWSNMGVPFDDSGENLKHLQDGIDVYNVLRDVKAFTWQPHTKQYAPSPGRRLLFAPAQEKSRSFLERYNTLLNNIFSANQSVETGDESRGVPSAKHEKSSSSAPKTYYPSTHEFANKTDVCLGQSNLYRIVFPVHVSATSHRNVHTSVEDHFMSAASLETKTARTGAGVELLNDQVHFPQNVFDVVALQTSKGFCETRQ